MLLKYAIIGFGGLGQLHFRRQAQLKEGADCEVKLVALCDVEGKFDQAVATNITSHEEIDIEDIRTYLSVDELLANEELDFVITAVPTYLHAEIANTVMNRGIHVFSEKPMAISYEAALSMYETSRKNNVKLMIGQVCRFENMYNVIKELIDTNKYGRVIRADFSRYSGLPIWGWQNWYMDESKSGGAALDMHVHDVDIVNYLFGAPKAVSSVESHKKIKFDTIITRYVYDDKLITSTGDWANISAVFPFHEGVFVQFETATVEFVNGALMCYPEGGEAYELETKEEKAGYAYAAEEIDFVNCIVHDRVSEINPVESTLITMKMAMAEKESATTGKLVEIK